MYRARKPKTLLFVSRDGSARALMAQALVESMAEGQYAGFAAGLEPAADADPKVITFLQSKGHKVENLTPRPVSDFEKGTKTKPYAVLTLSEYVEAKHCPNWPGFPFKALWATDEVADDYSNLEEVYEQLQTRVYHLIEIPFEGRKRAALNRWVELIGQID